MVDEDVDGQPITGDPAEHVMRLVIKLSPDRNTGSIEPAAEQAHEPAPQRVIPTDGGS